MRHHENYSQKFLRVLNFLIAAVMEFSQGSDGTRKRRIAECFGSLGWTSVHPRELRESEDRRGRSVQSAGDCLPQGAPIVRRRPPPVRVRPCDKRPGWRSSVFRDDLPSGRSALFPAQCGGSDRRRRSLRAGRRPKGAFGLRPGAIRGVSRGAAGGWVERGRSSTGLGLPRGSRSSRRSWGFARVRYDGLD